MCLRNSKVDVFEVSTVEKTKEAASKVWRNFVYRIVSKVLFRKQFS